MIKDFIHDSNKKNKILNIISIESSEITFKLTNDSRIELLFLASILGSHLLEIYWSLDKRCNDLMNDDALIYSTLIDPNFGLMYFRKTYFELEKQTKVRASFLAKLKRDEATRQVKSLYFVLLFNQSLILRVSLNLVLVKKILKS
jgi:hypothetical protein